MSRKEFWRINPKAGFSLLEVMVVLTLILLLAGLIYPMSGGLNQRLLIKLSLKQLQDDLSALRAQALGGSETPMLIFEPEKDYYLIQLGASSLKRPLAGLKIAADSELKIIFSVTEPPKEVLTFTGTNGIQYHINFNQRGEPVINQERSPKTLF